MKKEIKERIRKAIQELDLKKNELDVITVKNLDKICELSECKLYDVMYYIRYERGE